MACGLYHNTPHTMEWQNITNFKIRNRKNTQLERSSKFGRREMPCVSRDYVYLGNVRLVDQLQDFLIW